MPRCLLKSPSAVLVLLVISFPVTTLGAVPDSSVDKESPSYFYPDTAGLSLQYESATMLDETILYTSTSTITFSQFVEFDGVPAWLLEFTSEKDDANGKSGKFAMSIYQQVDSDVSRTRAFRYPNGSLFRQEDFFIDLKGPLVEGGTWRFTCPMPHYAGEPRTEIMYVYESRIEKTGVSVSTAAGQFTNCILVREIGRSASPVTVNCPDGTTVETDVQVERLRYWAPHIGDVKETSTERYGMGSTSDEACFAYYYSSELTKILAKPE